MFPTLGMRKLLGFLSYALRCRPQSKGGSCCYRAQGAFVTCISMAAGAPVIPINLLSLVISQHQVVTEHCERVVAGATSQPSM
jgi:hypothetical protein